GAVRSHAHASDGAPRGIRERGRQRAAADRQPARGLARGAALTAVRSQASGGGRSGALAGELSRTTRGMSVATGCIVGWEPVLDGELADAAMRVVHDIARAIAAAPVDASSSDGVLYWAYTCAAIDEPFAQAAYERAVDDLVADLQRGAPHAGLHDGGLAGMAFALGHVLDGDVGLAAVDELLVRLLDVERWTGPFDLTRGLVGFGVYFRARADAPTARAGLERVVDHLAKTAIRDDAGARWHTPRELLPDVYHADWPDGYVDLGVAHGMAGVIAFLARAGLDAALCD